ncbi:hypothetical protein L6164_006728 [Bauhinia variegata]|uniref:Uncharacterized protein n=1 Tax=Bauhinia variegata TaxID=167791 RepID=A0ACB9PV99_BAUVA|nr:hypothetical protein L6164_006728 [Bauhinia variegata]
MTKKGIVCAPYPRITALTVGLRRGDVICKQVAAVGQFNDSFGWMASSFQLLPGNPDWEKGPFDFLIDGELVRMSLEQFLLAKGISAEKVLEIEYIKAVVPRKEESSSHEHLMVLLLGSL